MEIWKPIKGYEGYYEISNKGNVRSLDRYVKYRFGKKLLNSKYMSISPMKGKRATYYAVCLSKEGKRKTHQIHRLVAETFIPNPLNKRCVNHIDYNTKNNRVENLEWCTHEENNNHSYERRKKSLKGINRGLKFKINKNTGEPYIRFHKRDKKYEVYLRFNGQYIFKQFKDIEDAKKWRDEKIKKYLLGGNNEI